MTREPNVRVSTSSRVFENTIFGVSFQMRANSSSVREAEVFSSAVAARESDHS
jgi:hypothetical protein